MKLTLTQDKVLKYNVVVFLSLLILNLMSILLYGFEGRPGIDVLYKVLGFNRENNIPTFYSVLNLMFSSGLLFIIAVSHRRKKEPYSYWITLSGIFLFLAVDEGVAIHEKLTRIVKIFIDVSGVFTFAWIIPYSLFLVLFLLSYLRFLKSLSVKTRVLFLISGAVYVGGAIGMEMIGGYYSDLAGRDNITYSLITTVEESFEMVGIIIFIYALLDYIKKNIEEVKIIIT